MISPPSSSSHPDTDASEIPDDPRLLVIVREYLAKLEAHENPDPEEYIARHPELSDAVRSCLEGLDLVYRSVKTDKNSLANAAQGFTSTPVLNSTDPRINSSSNAPLPEPLGDFRILRELGRGGMGIVYEALQSSLARRVALKVLPFTATLQPRQLQRFLNEAQAVAHLHHPNIVPVFAVGCDRGVHYYAMQLIEGMSLEELLVKLRTDAGITDALAAQSSGKVIDDTEKDYHRSPSHPTMELFSSQVSTERNTGRGDYFRTVARFGLQAAEALAYAHEVGIVHRDVKPANLMVDSRGKVWITDFGLAQVRSGAELTQTGDMIGTLRYMSPEQVQGDRAQIDHRTDIYSLGATLYELATLRPMFSATNRQSLLHQVLIEEPEAPRSLNKAMPVELETIIVKAISKSAGDRYATVQQLGDDLRRLLSDQPILAKRPTWADHARKWARRHPSTVAGTLLLLLLLSVGLFIHNRSITYEQSQTTAALGREKVRSKEAEQSFQQARQAVDLLIEISDDELADKPQLQATRKRLLNAALAYYQDFIAQRRDNPASQQEMVVVENRVKGILRELSIVSSLFQAKLSEDPDVQADLQITAEQKEQLKALHQDMEQKFSAHLADSNPPSLKDGRQRFIQLAELQTNQLLQILTPKQQERLKQIWVQSQRIFAFQEPDVIDSLQLTTEQRQQIRDIEFQTIIGRGPPPFDRPPPDGERHFRGPPPHHEEDEQRMREALEKIVALFTAEQVTRWEQLTGPKFNGRGPIFHPGFRGGPPPFRGPPGERGREERGRDERTSPDSCDTP